MNEMLRRQANDVIKMLSSFDRAESAPVVEALLTERDPSGPHGSTVCGKLTTQEIALLAVQRIIEARKQAIAANLTRQLHDLQRRRGQR